MGYIYHSLQSNTFKYMGVISPGYLYKDSTLYQIYVALIIRSEIGNKMVNKVYHLYAEQNIYFEYGLQC